MSYYNSYVNTRVKINSIMPRKMKRELPPLKVANEAIGKRIARIRKSCGYTQSVLAKKIGIERYLVTDYETGRLHLNDTMLIRFALALEVSSDEILGLKNRKNILEKPDLKTTKRFIEIEKLPPLQKKSLLNTIDAYLKANKQQKAS